MKVSVPTIRDRVAQGLATREWPGNAARLLAKSQGDYDFVDDVRAALEGALDAAGADEVPLESLVPRIEDPPWDEQYAHLYGWHLAFVLNLLADARIGEPRTETRADSTIDGDETLGSLVVQGDLVLARGALLVCGDLSISGDLRSEKGELRVCGSTRVGARWLDHDEFMQKVIVGDLSVGGPMLTRGQTFVLGDVRASEVLVNNPGWVGFMKVVGDLDAARLVRLNGEQDWLTEVHGEERLTGEPPADAKAAIEEAFATHGI